MPAPHWLPLGAGVLFGATSLASVVIARRLPRERRYDQYGTACVLGAASLAVAGGEFVPDHGPWDPWIIGCFLIGLAAALWFFRRGRLARTESGSRTPTSEISARPSNDR